MCIYVYIYIYSLHLKTGGVCVGVKNECTKCGRRYNEEEDRSRIPKWHSQLLFFRRDGNPHRMHMLLVLTSGRSGEFRTSWICCHCSSELTTTTFSYGIFLCLCYTNIAIGFFFYASISRFFYFYSNPCIFRCSYKKFTFYFYRYFLTITFNSNSSNVSNLNFCPILPLGFNFKIIYFNKNSNWLSKILTSNYWRF